MKKLNIKLPPISKRVRASLVVFGINMLCIFVAAPMALTNLEDMERTERSLRQDHNIARGRIKEAQDDLTFYNDNLSIYLSLLKRGLLDPQDRLEAISSLEKLARKHIVTISNYELFPQSVGFFTNQALKQYEIHDTVIKISANALLDGHMVEFIQEVHDAFPGVAVLSAIEMRRQDAISDNALRSIRNGTPVPLLASEIEVHWRVARPKGSAEAEGGGQ